MPFGASKKNANLRKGAAQRRRQANERREAEAIEVREIIEQARQQERGEVVDNVMLIMIISIM